MSQFLEQKKCKFTGLKCPEECMFDNPFKCNHYKLENPLSTKSLNTLKEML